MVRLVFPFVKRKLNDGTYVKEPKIPLTFIGKENSVEVLAILDTGSTISHIPFYLAEALGFDKSKAEPATTRGIGGEEPMADFTIDLKISRKNQSVSISHVPVLVFLDPEVKFCIIGLEPVFERFDVCFKLADGKIDMKEH